MEHTYAKFPGLPVPGAFSLLRETDPQTNITSRLSLETAGFLLDINAEAELLAGTGRGQHGSGVKKRQRERMGPSCWFWVSSGALDIDEYERS